MSVRWLAIPVLAGLAAACGPPAPAPLPPGSFAFGVFADGPYYGWERGRFRRALADMGRADVDWLLHVGDFLWYPCSDAAYETRLDELNGVDFPVIYTPGDNEWADCHEERPGGYDPLERLAALRGTFFAHPERSLGGRPLALESQAAEPGFAEFPEHARWTRGGFVFATLHLVGSWNASVPFEGRTPAHDSAVARRTEAVLAWVDAAFDRARRDAARGVVLATHANPGLEGGPEDARAFEPFVDRLKRRVAEFPGPVLLVHGDWHELTVDQPLRRPDGTPYENFTRLQTFGSPDIGWVRVVVDTAAGRFTAFEPRLMRGWW
jgi:hypothetical protein